VLPEGFASDSMRMMRFTREAQVLASFNHSNIAGIYGVEDQALVMELVPGGWQILRRTLSGLGTAVSLSRRQGPAGNAMDCALLRVAPGRRGAAARVLEQAGEVTPILVASFNLACIPSQMRWQPERPLQP